ncbi:hypothetical protein MIR68_001116 [Amoeboaphelidium protococcarum]|nr:hypothetical protein MIR68_001116 [Amoeboaphelidium protococcarum]
MSHQSSNRQQSSRSKSVKSQPTWQLPKTRLALPNSSDFEDKSADGQIHVTTEEFDSVKRGLTAAENRKLRETLLAFGERFCASRILDNKYANWRDIEVVRKRSRAVWTCWTSYELSRI